MDISNHSALITGGASGLGGATARALAASGAKVAILDLNEEAGQAMASELGGIALPCDVTDPAAAEAAIARTRNEIGAPRSVVNCAGIGVAERIVGREGPMELDHFARVININLIGSFNIMRLAAAEMIKLDALDTEERGVIINTASVAAFDGQIGQAAYAASKGGIAALTLPAAREFGRFGVRVMTIAPGILLTPMFDILPDAARDALVAITVFPQRLGHAEEYAKMALAIVDNPLLNGETIRLDGAIRMPPR
ncbi:MAG: SDR family NAD(P)-dependent oxidoreductase [Pseudomonadota bacterium]|nr:SDR family NAD(P)-dependent oxidoreductase [Pseudomonadota bacterium]